MSKNAKSIAIARCNQLEDYMVLIKDLATKLIRSVKHLSYRDKFRWRKLPSLKKTQIQMN